MDPISASCLNLNAERQPFEDKPNFKEKPKFKTLLPQILASLIVTSYHVVLGITLAYSAILLPQLEDDSSFEISKSGASWIASIIALTCPVGGIVAGYLTDSYGRLNTIKLAMVPGVTGWIMIALAPNVPVIIIGRTLTAFATALGQSPAIVYVTEIARVDMRGSLISFAPALASLGMVLTFLKGWLMDWRQVAWCCTLYTIVPCLAVFLIPESPPWLVSKSRLAQAKKSLDWINKYQPNVTDAQLGALLKDHELEMIENSKTGGSAVLDKAREFLKPTGIKPTFILTGLFFFQQFSGIFIFLFYSISFFKEVGTTFNPYIASIFIGTLRFVMCMSNTYALSKLRRRPLFYVSCVGMACCVFVSGLYSNWIKTGETTQTWVPMVFLLLFVVTSMIGIVPIPFTMTAELFPLKIRGVAQSVILGVANLLMFASLQSYPYLCDLLGGISNLQYFFAADILIGAVFIYFFVPETHGMKLKDIEEYFKSNLVYPFRNKESSVAKTEQSRKSLLVENASA